MREHRSIVTARGASRSPCIGAGAGAVAALVLVQLAGCGGNGGDRLSGELPSAAAAPNQAVRRRETPTESNRFGGAGPGSR
jgi:predicted small lipoprotein YifL